MRKDPPNRPDGHPSGNPLRRLTPYAPLVDRLFAEIPYCAWDLTRANFEDALERSAAKRFASAAVPPAEIEAYLGALHIQDLALASACAADSTRAWEHFVSTYREYLRSAAAAILRCPAASPAACEFADSLFSDLYGLGDGPPNARSLFRYFHGRSSLKTWLRAVLAQRHVDRIRTDRRFTQLDGELDGQRDGQPSFSSPPLAARAAQPIDPHRPRYVALFTRALEVALGLLDPRDKERLRLYYAEERILAEIGRKLGEHESSVSRNLERTRRALRHDVEEALRKGLVVAGSPSSPSPLSEAEISLSFEYASEDAPIDFDKLFPPGAATKRTAERQEP